MQLSGEGLGLEVIVMLLILSAFCQCLCYYITASVSEDSHKWSRFVSPFGHHGNHFLCKEQRLS